MQNSIGRLLTDPRAPAFHSCIQCGACSGICPATSVDKNYNPRRIMACLLAKHDVAEYPYEKCFSCYSCKYVCRMDNCVADIFKVLIEQEQLDTPNIFLDSIFEKGLCVTIDAFSPYKFPEWGNSWREIYDNENHEYRKLPQESINEIQIIINKTKHKKYHKEDDIVEIKKKIIPRDKIYLFHSCVADALYPGIIKSIKYIFDRIGIDYIEDPRHSTCTGFGCYNNKIPLATTLAINARNFSLAEECGYPNITSVCQTSYGLLNESLAILKTNIGKRINDDVLSAINRRFNSKSNNITITHASEILWSERNRIKEAIIYKFNGLRVAVHNGCHYIKMFRKLAIPTVLDDLLSTTDAEVVDYAEQSLCCGMGFNHTVESSERYLTRSIAERKLMSIKESDADIILVACPGCQATLDRNQAFIEKDRGREIKLPVLNYAQLIALAMGADAYNVAGIQTHSVPVEPILEDIDIL